MADTKRIEATARIPTRPLSIEHKDLAEIKEVLVDYKKGIIHIKTEDGNVVKAGVSDASEIPISEELAEELGITDDENKNLEYILKELNDGKSPNIEVTGNANLNNTNITGTTNVSGDATFTGTTKITDADVTTLDVSGDTNLKNTTIDGDTSVSGNATFAANKQVNLNGTTKITDADVTTLDVSGTTNLKNTTITGTSTVTGAATFNGDITTGAGKRVNLNGTTVLSGDATFEAGHQVNLNGTTKITDADITTLDVSGATNLKNTTITGTTKITDADVTTLDVSGDTNLKNTTIDGNATVTGNAAFSGSVTGVSQVFEITIGTDWVKDENYEYYTQTIPNDNILSTDVPIVDINLNNIAYDNKKEVIEAYGKIYRITTNDKSITVYADEPIEFSINIQLKLTR